MREYEGMTKKMSDSAEGSIAIHISFKEHDTKYNIDNSKSKKKKKQNLSVSSSVVV